MRVLLALESDIHRDGRICKEAASLRKWGAEVTLLGFRSELRRRRGFPFRAITLPIASRRRRRLRNVSIAVNLALLNLRLLFTRADVYHAHNTMFLVGAFLASRLHRGKLVYDCREVMEEAHPLMAWLERRFIRRADLVINVSEGRADRQAAMHGLAREDIVVIHNYTELPAEERPPAPPVDPPRLLFCGGYHLRDNRMDDFLEILAGLPGVPLDLVAFEYGYSGHKLQNMVRDLGLADRVRFLPPVPFEDVLGVMARYDIAVDMLTNPEGSLSKRYPAICKTSSYLAAGLPVLCSNMEAFREEVEDLGVGLVIDPADKPAAREKISGLLRNPERIREMRERALRLARERFNWGVDEQKLVRAYERMTGGRPTGDTP